MIVTLSGVTRTKKPLQRLQFQIQKVPNWLTSSGLKVNIEKTEIVIFYKTDTATTSIKLNEIEVYTKKQMSVLGVIFDSKLEWSFQIENSVKKQDEHCRV
jgi:hypothetical protein